jgi:putative transposase
VKYKCIHAHRSQFSLELMCRVLSVSRSGYYAWRKRKPSPRSKDDVNLLHAIREVHTATRGRYGSPRVYKALRDRGVKCGRSRVARLMRKAHLRGIAARRRKPKMLSSPAAALPNLVQRDFRTGVINRIWASDITYVHTEEGWLFLAVVIDVGSRKVIGWSMSSRPDCDLVIAALDMAVQHRQPGKGLVHHSDRGIHYTSQRYRRLLEQHGFQASYSRTGDCWDNAVVESFFHTLKSEEGLGAYANRRIARRSLFEFIEVWYNRRRQHSSLGNISPTEFENRLRHYVH